MKTQGSCAIIAPARTPVMARGIRKYPVVMDAAVSDIDLAAASTAIVECVPESHRISARVIRSIPQSS